MQATASQPTGTIVNPFPVHDPKSALVVPIPPTVIPYARSRFTDFDDNGQLYSYWGYVTGPNEPPIRDYELVFEQEDELRLSDIPGLDFLRSNDLDMFILKNTSLVLLGIDMAPKKAGLWLETDIRFSGLLQRVSDVMKLLFLNIPGDIYIHLSAHLGMNRDIEQDNIETNDITLTASIQSVNSDLGDWIRFQSVGIEVFISYRTGDINVAFKGDLHLKVPNAITPLVLRFEAIPDEDFVTMNMGTRRGEKWKDVFGVSGLDLDSVEFITTADLKNNKKDIAIRSVFESRSTRIKLEGVIAVGGSSYFRASVENFTWQDVKNIFYKICGKELEKVEHDIIFHEIVFQIGGGCVSLEGSFSVGEYTCAKGLICITKTGVLISGGIADLSFGAGVTVSEAKLELMVGEPFIPPSQPAGQAPLSDKRDDGKDHQLVKSDDPVGEKTTTQIPSSKPKESETTSGGSQVAAPEKTPSSTSEKELVGPKDKAKTRIGLVVSGVVYFQEIRFAVTVSVFRGAQGGAEVVVFGELDAHTIKIGELLKNDEIDKNIDISLHRVSLIYSNVDNPKMGTMNACRYPIKQGLQVCAQVGPINLLEEITRAPPSATDSCTLVAGWSKDGGLSARIILPDHMRINISPKVRTGRLSLYIQTKPSMEISLEAVIEAKFQPQHEDHPLEFIGGFGYSSKGFAGRLTMKGDWENPFGLSPRITVGPRNTIAIKINPATFAATGLPSELGIEGSLVVDKKYPYHIAVLASNNPTDFLIKAYIPKLEIAEIVAFVNSVLDTEHKAPQDILRFEGLDVYAAAGTCTIGDAVFPPGFWMKGTAFICGRKAASMDCTIGKNGMKLLAEIPGFELGPLKLSGADGPDARFDFEITPQRQHFEISGLISLCDLSTKIKVVAEILPMPDLQFEFRLKWSELVDVGVEGKLIRPEGEKGAIDMNASSLRDADFYLEASLEQHLIDEVSKQMIEYFGKIAAGGKEKLQAAQRDLAKAEEDYARDIEEKQRIVDEKKATFDAALAQVQAQLKTAQATFDQGMAAAKVLRQSQEGEAELKKAAAQKKYDDDVGIAQAGYNKEKARIDRLEQDTKQNLQDKLVDLHNKRMEFERKFGDAYAAIDRARQSVEHEERRVREADDYINQRRRELDNARWYEKPGIAFHIGALETARLGLICALNSAKFILQGAQFVVGTGVFTAFKIAVDIAESALRTAQDAVSGLANTCKRALDTAQGIADGLRKAALVLQNAAIDAAAAIAAGALILYEKTLKTLTETLKIWEDAVSAVMKGALWVAYQAAMGVLALAKKTGELLILGAKALVKAAEKGLEVAMNVAISFCELLRNSINIQYIKLTGSLRAVVSGGCFTIAVKGILAGVDINFKGAWSPQNTLDWIVAMCEKLWSELKDVLAAMIMGKNFDDSLKLTHVGPQRVITQA